MTRPRTQTKPSDKNKNAKAQGAAQSEQRGNRAPENKQDTERDVNTADFFEPRGTPGISVGKTGDATDPSPAGGLATKETTKSDR
jgi:hypothetical protein